MLYEHIDTYEVGVDDEGEPVFNYKMEHGRLLRRAKAAATNETGHRNWKIESFDWYVDDAPGYEDVPYVARYILRKAKD